MGVEFVEVKLRPEVALVPVPWTVHSLVYRAE